MQTHLLRWIPPRTRPAAIGSRWVDWRRWADHQRGGFQRRLAKDVSEVEALQQAWRSLDEDQLDQKLTALRIAFRLDAASATPAPSRQLRIEALAAISIAAHRTLDRLPYRVQLLAALAMHEGLVVQMAAGEGKTLAVALVAVLRGWRGLPCHVVTSNDYLAQRDVNLMQPLFQRCQVSAAAAVHGQTPQALQAVYACDLVYATSKQLLADHLLDCIALGGATDAMRRRIGALRSGAMVRSRGLHTAIVDEADSVLIDEAITPLIISAAQPNPLLVEAVTAARHIADDLEVGRDYRIHPQIRAVDFTPEGLKRLEQVTHRLPAVWHSPERRDDLISQALCARDLYVRDQHYIVQDGKIEILDEHTGRVLPGRTWSYGLHQAIEVREGVDISHPSKTMARMSFQEFFRHYHHLSGASGTLQGVRSELWWTYGLLTFVVPTRLPSRLRLQAVRHFATAEEKWTALVNEVERLHRQQVPVLVGTRRLVDSERVKVLLAAKGLASAVLNAKQHQQEADIVARAGSAGSITVATNMAGRGTDILLGEGVVDQGGLHVVMAEPHDSVRVDWQLFGRAGRQGQPGHAQMFVSFEDDLLQNHVPQWLVPMRQVLARNSTLSRSWLPWFIRWVQRQAQRRAFQQRQQLQTRELQIRKQLSFAAGEGSA